MIRAILTDVEGTTTPVAFVTEVLFPCARAALPGFLAARRDDPEVAAQLDAARREAGEPALSFDGTVARLLAWIDEDRKIGPLKALQGLVWREGDEGGT
jgi:enolase-phosphatase E1